MTLTGIFQGLRDTVAEFAEDCKIELMATSLYDPEDANAWDPDELAEEAVGKFNQKFAEGYRHVDDVTADKDTLRQARDAQSRAERLGQESAGNLADLNAVRAHLVAWAEKKLKGFEFVEPREKIAQLPEHAEWQTAEAEEKAAAQEKLDAATAALIKAETALQQTAYLNGLRAKVSQELPKLNPAAVDKHYSSVVEQVVKDAAELVRVTRRTTIQDDYKKKHAEWEAGDRSGPEPKEPIIVKISIGGSGDAGWRTHCDISGAYATDDTGMGPERSSEAIFIDNASIHHRRLDESKFSFDYAGPGAPNTYGFGYLLGGSSDTGSNSIWNLTDNVPEDMTPEIASALNKALNLAQADIDAQSEKSAVDLRKAINETLDKADAKQQLVILIKGHSRGAVAAAHVAKRLKQYFPAASVELTQVDPVPGPGQFASNKSVDVGELDETTVVYSIFSGHGFHFTSEKVLNAKRIIVSAQAHGVGIQNGFKIGNKRYKGAALNSLDPGVYRDDNPDISVVGELKKIASPEHFKKVFVEVYNQRYGAGTEGRAGANYDPGRQEQIEAALEGIKKLDSGQLAETMEVVVEQL